MVGEVEEGFLDEVFFDLSFGGLVRDRYEGIVEGDRSF